MTKAAPMHDKEEQRIASLHKTGLLDSGGSERFDKITALATQTFKVETSVVSLVDTDRQWFLSSCGLDEKETARDVAFCAHAINEKTIMVVNDARADPRFKDNPLVTEHPHIRFYAGAVINDPEGLPLGTLCIFDPEPREFSMQDQNTLRTMANLVEQGIFGL